MRERHPIDEHFKRALYNAEAEPPEAVRAALGTRLGWAGASRTGWSMWSFVVVAVGLLGTGAALWAWESAPVNSGSPKKELLTNERGRASKQGIPGTQQDSRAAGGGGILDIIPGATRTPSEGSTDDLLESQVEQAGSARKKTGRQPTTGARVAAASSSKQIEQDSSMGLADHQNNGTGPSPTTRSSSSGSADQDPSSTATVPAGSIKGGWVRKDPTASPASMALDVRPNHLAPLSIALDPLIATGQPIGRQAPPDYVLPSSTWWVGPYVGLGSVKGRWMGADADALQSAEQWRSTAQAGVLVGHTWRNGWGASAGLGLARVRSTFQHEQAGQAFTVLEIDTAWATAMHTSGDVLYSWAIDSLVEERAGGIVRKDARNLYTAVQIPVLAHWTGELQRFSYGAFGGVTVWVPTQRKGLTLARSAPDAQSTAIALQDPRVDERFSTQVHGTMGLSLGYSLTERIGVYVEPMITTPLISFTEEKAPKLTRPLIQFRLHYELPCKVR